MDDRMVFKKNVMNRNKMEQPKVLDLNYLRFLHAYRGALQNETVIFEKALTIEEWKNLFQLAQSHQVLPMIYEAVYGGIQKTSATSKNKDSEDIAEIQYYFASIKGRVIQSVTMQMMRTNAFSKLYSELEKKSFRPLVVKGIICRSLYPKPDYRISGDEDLLISADQYEAFHEELLALGMMQADESTNRERDYEIPYLKPGSPLYIEVHKSLFSPRAEAYGDFNRYYETAKERVVSVVIDGTEYWTLQPTDHLFYLICHAFKHFLHGGFGIRQVSDIVLFANTYGTEINWHELLENTKEIRADVFTAALFKIGLNYLTFDPDRACYSEEWNVIQIDESMLLKDLLEAGVFGASSMERKNSSNMTLSAVESEKKGKSKKFSLLKTAFPPASAIDARYSYLKRYPFLLPVAWISRLLTYRKEVKEGKRNASESIQIGENRIQLLREYQIIKK